MRATSQSTAPTFIDCFAGAGGLSRGLSDVGLLPKFAFDFDPLACQTYAKNLGDHIECLSISDITPAMVRRRVGGAPDIVAGGPPCQGFSTQRRGPSFDTRNDLVARFFELAVALSPKIILMENVPGVLGSRGDIQISSAIELLQDKGYDFNADVLDASSVGVPQRRKRAVFVAWKTNSVKPFEFDDLPNFEKPRTVRDAIGDLPTPPRDFTEHQKFPNHTRVKISPANIDRISHVPQGGGRLDIPRDLQLACHRDTDHRHLDVFGRLEWNQPSATITARFDNFSRGRFAHPKENRNITNREGARLQSFPDEFVFVGPKKEVAKQIGNAVPPLMAQEIGRVLLKMLRLS